MKGEKLSNSFSKPKPLELSSSESQLDVTGTPLEDDCDIDLIDESLTGLALNAWTDEEASYLPIPIEASR